MLRTVAGGFHGGHGLQFRDGAGLGPAGSLDIVGREGGRSEECGSRGGSLGSKAAGRGT